jgi:hypothetical protein
VKTEGSTTKGNLSPDSQPQGTIESNIVISKRICNDEMIKNMINFNKESKNETID